MSVPTRSIGGRQSPPSFFHRGASASSFGLQPASSEELLHVSESCGRLSAVGITSAENPEYHSLFSAANTFLSAVQAMDKHVMLPNRLRDHRLPPTAHIPHNCATLNSDERIRSRHGSGNSQGAGSMAAVSMNSECNCSDPGADSGIVSSVTDELVDTDMYSCYRLLNNLKDELLSDKNYANSEDSEESDSDQADRVTPKDEFLMFSTPNTVDSNLAAAAQSALNVNINSDTLPMGYVPDHSQSRRMTSASAIASSASHTHAIKQRFRTHLHGLMTILSQLTDTANVMTNYYDQCIIPGGAASPSCSASNNLSGNGNTSSTDGNLFQSARLF